MNIVGFTKENMEPRNYRTNIKHASKTRKNVKYQNILRE